MRTSNLFVARHLAAARALLVFTLLLGLGYPLAMVGVAQLPGLNAKADGSLIRDGDQVVGSRLIGQSFTDADGNPLPAYFQSRPSAAGAGYDPTSTSASNLGPEDVVDTPDRPSLLTQVCARSLAVGELEGVDGSRPYCTHDGVGAVLGVYYTDGLTGEVVRAVSLNQTSGTPFLDRVPGCAGGARRARRRTTRARWSSRSAATRQPTRSSPPTPSPPAPRAWTPTSRRRTHASRRARVARERGIEVAEVQSLIDEYTHGRALGLFGQAGVNVLELNLALDERYPQP